MACWTGCSKNATLQGNRVNMSFGDGPAEHCRRGLRVSESIENRVLRTGYWGRAGRSNSFAINETRFSKENRPHERFFKAKKRKTDAASRHRCCISSQMRIPSKSDRAAQKSG